MYINGQGVKQSNSKAKDLFETACDMILQEGCDAYDKLNRGDG